MKRKRFQAERIVEILREAEREGASVAEVCRAHAVSEATFYRWKKVYGGMPGREARELRHLRDENAKLKRLVADLSLDKAMLQDVVQNKF